MYYDEMHKAICEACPHLIEWHDESPYWKGSWSAVGEGNEHFAAFDPLNDLNAMHEVEKTLTESQRADYAHELINHFKPDFDNIHATAPQRAEAFLKAKGLWKDRTKRTYTPEENAAALRDAVFLMQQANELDRP